MLVKSIYPIRPVCCRNWKDTLNKSIGVGAQIRYDFRGGQPLANVGVGINMNEMADLVYETGFNITAPVSMQKMVIFLWEIFRYKNIFSLSGRGEYRQRRTGYDRGLYRIL